LPARQATLRAHAPPRALGLRALSREQLDAFLRVAQCAVVAETHAAFDAYVLSESSLFLFPTKLVIKTCGTTALLAALPCALRLAASVGAQLRRVRYTRACFQFPHHQPAPHRSWAEECAFLDGALQTRGQARVMGAEGGLRWHVYCAALGPAPAGAEATVTLEICMWQLDARAASRFVFGAASALPSARSVTEASGIGALFPADTLVDDFLFSPCGYSMNGLLGASLASIHVTPEQRCSYASLEVSGRAADLPCPQQLLRRTAQVFGPGALSVALTVDGARGVPREWAAAALPDGFVRTAATRAELPGGGFVHHLAGAALEGRQGKSAMRVLAAGGRSVLGASLELERTAATEVA